MARLRNDIKIQIVRLLAVFKSPTEVSGLIKEEFGILVSPPAIQAYDPTKRQGKDLSQRLREEFFESRKLFIENTANIPVANAAYRLQVMQDIIDHAGKNHILKLQVVKQAAQETGGVFQNYRGNASDKAENNDVITHVNAPDED